MADMPSGGPDVPDVPTVTVVHKVKSKLGYTEIHSTAPGFGENEKELVGSTTSDRNWKGITIAIGVILLVLCGVAISVVLMTPEDTGPRVKGSRFSIKHILDHKLMPRRFNGSWISDNELVFRDSSGGLSIFSVDSLNQTQVVSNTTFRRFDVIRYVLSPNRKFVLLIHKVTKRFRFSSWAQYTIFEINSGLTWDVSSESEDESELAENLSKGLPLQPNKLLYASWLPSSDGLAPIIFVENFTIYYIRDVGAKVRKVYPISRQDLVVPEVVIHGIPDWIYEEDILKRGDAIWISPDGDNLVYATFNDSNVQEVRWKIYGNPSDAIVDPYPKEGKMRYPKAGTRNPTVSLYMVNLTSLQFEEIRPPLLFRDIEYYFTDVSWIESKAVAVIWMNRAQNISLVTSCGPPTWICKETYRETVDESAWSTLYTAPMYSSNGSSFLLLAPLRDGDYGNFRHIALIETVQSHLVHPITFGSFEVESIIGWNEAEGIIYFCAIPQENPSQRHIYYTSDNWRSGPKYPDCLTCNLPNEIERSCLFTQVKFNPSYQYFVLECHGPDVPASYLMEVNLVQTNQTFIMVLDNNTEAVNFSASMAWPMIEKMIIPLPSIGGEERFARARLYLPPELRKEETIKYPMVVHVYAGPGSQLVLDDWKIDFNTYMASGLSYLVLEVDASGSGGQGEEKMTEIKNQLGQLEVQDQLDAAKFVANNFSFIDPERVAVTGVSYGGYVAGLMLADRVKDVLACGVSVTPVVDWRFYESAYTERYMGFPIPTENFRGYQEGSLIDKAKHIRGKAFLLAHGMADRNVHFQNSILLAKTLVEHNIPFEQHFYADEGHFLDGVKSHLYTSVSRFLERCLYKPMQPVEGDITYAYKKGHLVASFKERDEEDDDYEFGGGDETDEQNQSQREADRAERDKGSENDRDTTDDKNSKLN